MRQISELGFAADRLLVQSCIRIRGRVMRVIPAGFPVEIHGRILRVVRRGRPAVLRPETLVARPRLEQRAVDREMLIRQEPVRANRREHFGEERIGDVALEQASRFFVKVVASQTGPSMLRPTNQR
jgi:hypothetical protein